MKKFSKKNVKTFFKKICRKFFFSELKKKIERTFQTILRRKIKFEKNNL